MGDIFKEVEEDLRRDRWETLWKKYGSYVVGVVAAILIATAGWVAWQEYERRQAVAITATLHNAMSAARADQTDAAIEAFGTVTEEGNERQVALALFQEAALRAQSGDLESARGLYRSLRENDSLDAPYRALATIRSVELDLDTGDAQEMLGWLAPLSGNESPWRHIAWELAAYLEQRVGDPAAARGLLERLLDDPESPTAARARAEAYLAQF